MGAANLELGCQKCAVSQSTLYTLTADRLQPWSPGIAKKYPSVQETQKEPKWSTTSEPCESRGARSYSS